MKKTAAQKVVTKVKTSRSMFRFLKRRLISKVSVQEICYRLKRYDVRGTLGYVEKGCRAASSCTPDMYIWFSGFCDGVECIQCLDNPATCNGPQGKRRKQLFVAK